MPQQFMKTARSALRKAFGSDQPKIPLEFRDLFGHKGTHAGSEEAAIATDDINTNKRVFSFAQRHPKRVDCRFQALNYKGSRDRQYRLFIPSSYQHDKPVALVMVLHGCLQNHLEIANVSGFDQLAEREGFIVAYPFVSSYRELRAKNCWGWWFPSQTRAGAGEVEDLKQILDEIKSNYSIDSKQVHVTGLSSGASMAVALMVAHANEISSGCSVAGVAYSESAQAVHLFRPIPPRYRPVPKLVRNMEKQMPDGKHPVPLLIIHSHDDETLNIKAAENLRDSWASCYGISLMNKSRVKTGETKESTWHYTRYTGPSSRHHIDTLWLEGPGHGWYGGNPGKFSYPNAVDITHHIWQFFKSHPG